MKLNRTIIIESGLIKKVENKKTSNKEWLKKQAKWEIYNNLQKLIKIVKNEFDITKKYLYNFPPIFIKKKLTEKQEIITIRPKEIQYLESLKEFKKDKESVFIISKTKTQLFKLLKLFGFNVYTYSNTSKEMIKVPNIKMSNNPKNRKLQILCCLKPKLAGLTIKDINNEEKLNQTEFKEEWKKELLFIKQYFNNIFN